MAGLQHWLVSKLIKHTASQFQFLLWLVLVKVDLSVVLTFSSSRVSFSVWLFSFFFVLLFVAIFNILPFKLLPFFVLLTYFVDILISIFATIFGVLVHDDRLESSASSSHSDLCFFFINEVLALHYN